MGVTLLVLKWQVYVQKAERKHWKNTIARTAYVTEIINHRTFTQIHTPTVVQGRGVDGTPPRSFWYVAVFRNVFAFSKKPLIFLTRWGIFYGWWRCWRPVTSPTGSPSCPPSWILPRISALHEKQFLNKQFAWFSRSDLLLLWKDVEKTCTFTKKWLDHPLLVTSYLVSIATDHRWTYLKMCVRDEQTATKNVRCWCFIL